MFFLTNYYLQRLAFMHFKYTFVALVTCIFNYFSSAQCLHMKFRIPLEKYNFQTFVFILKYY